MPHSFTMKPFLLRLTFLLIVAFATSCVPVEETDEKSTSSLSDVEDEKRKNELKQLLFNHPLHKESALMYDNIDHQLVDDYLLNMYEAQKNYLKENAYTKRELILRGLSPNAKVLKGLSDNERVVNVSVMKRYDPKTDGKLAGEDNDSFFQDTNANQNLNTQKTSSTRIKDSDDVINHLNEMRYRYQVYQAIKNGNSPKGSSDSKNNLYKSERY